MCLCAFIENTNRITTPYYDHIRVILAQCGHHKPNKRKFSLNRFNNSTVVIVKRNINKSHGNAMDVCVFFLFFVYSLQLFSPRKMLNGNVYNKFNAALLGKFFSFFRKQWFDRCFDELHWFQRQYFKFIRHMHQKTQATFHVSFVLLKCF